jgi:uncharacterized FlaG/YvyC family protein
VASAGDVAQQDTVEGKWHRRLDQVTQQLAQSEERYIEMHQKYLDERREKEEQLATMREHMEKEIERYRDEAELHKERVHASL